MKRERRKFTNEFKAEVAIEAIKEKLTMFELAEKYKVNPAQIKAWKKEFLDNKASVFGSEGSSKAKREKEQLNKQEHALFEQIGRLKMENEWLKKSSMMTLDLRKSLVNKQDKFFTVEYQCQLLSIPKSRT
jgi:transposase-like protein